MANNYGKQSTYSEYTDAYGEIRQCKPRPVFGVKNYLSDEGYKSSIRPQEFLTSIDSYLNDTESSEEDKNKLNEYILYCVCPYMEHKLKESKFSSSEILKALPCLCCVKDAAINQYAMDMVLTILSRRPWDSDETMHKFLFELEEKLRGTINGTLLDSESAQSQGRRVFIYSKVLAMVVVLTKYEKSPCIPLRGWEEWCEDIVNLHKKLCKLNSQTPFIEKGCPRYAIALIFQSLQSLRLPTSKKNVFCMFLKWLAEYCQGNVTDCSMKDKVLKELIRQMMTKTGWFDFHVVISCLQSKILDDSPRCTKVLIFLVQMYCERSAALKWSKENRWQTGLHVGSVLANIIMKSSDEDARKQATLVLIYYMSSLESTSEEKLFVSQNVERSLCSRFEIVGKQVETFYKYKSSDEIDIRIWKEFLVNCRYSRFPAEFTELISSSNGKTCYKMRFRKEYSWAKIVLNSEGKSFSDFVDEVYYLRRVNERPHINILKVLAYDTCNKPFHVITEYAANGSLLQYLQKSREPDQSIRPSSLMSMISDILSGLIYIKEQSLLHREIMSSNILVAIDGTCKIAGFHAIQQMALNQMVNDYNYTCSLMDEISVRYCAPETLLHGKYSEKTMVFGISCVLFEVFTYGHIPFNWIPDKSIDHLRARILQGQSMGENVCIPQRIHEIIDWCRNPSEKERPNFEDLEKEFEIIELNPDLLKVEGLDLSVYDTLTEQDIYQSNPSVQDIENKVEDYNVFGHQTSIYDRPEIQTKKVVPQITEQVERTKEEDLKKLQDLKHRNIVEVIGISEFNPRYKRIHTEYSNKENLLELILARQCSPNDIVKFLVDIVSGLQYLHENRLLHCDIRAENMMVFGDKKQGFMVKIARLGRVRYLQTSPMAFKMHEDAIRRSAPEVIKNGIHSTSSDIWSLGLLCYELYIGYAMAYAPIQERSYTPSDCEPITCPEKDVLGYIESNQRPDKSWYMPDWIHILFKQTLLIRPDERPPAILLHDCLTYRKPFSSCFLSWWKDRHQKQIYEQKIDVDVEQPRGSTHVIEDDKHESFEWLRHKCPGPVFQQHTYYYVPGNYETRFSEEKIQNVTTQEVEEDMYEELPDLAKQVLLNKTDSSNISLQLRRNFGRGQKDAETRPIDQTNSLVSPYYDVNIIQRIENLQEDIYCDRNLLHDDIEQDQGQNSNRGEVSSSSRTNEGATHVYDEVYEEVENFQNDDIENDQGQSSNRGEVSSSSKTDEHIHQNMVEQFNSNEGATHEEEVYEEVRNFQNDDIENASPSDQEHNSLDDKIHENMSDGPIVAQETRNKVSYQEQSNLDDVIHGNGSQEIKSRPDEDTLNDGPIVAQETRNKVSYQEQNNLDDDIHGNGNQEIKSRQDEDTLNDGPIVAQETGSPCERDDAEERSLNSFTFVNIP